MERLGRNDLCWCGSGRKYKKCHSEFDSRLEEYRRKGVLVPPREILKNPRQVAGIRESASVNIAVLDFVAGRIGPGVSTEQIDEWVYEQTVSRGAVPATLHYQGFPKSVCTSVNEQVCHGIPSPNVVLQEGDIVNVDVSTVYHGYFSDSSRMFCVGQVGKEKRRLVETAQKCLQAGLSQVKPWGRLGDVGQATHDIARENGYTIVREIGGRGIGLEFHEEPWVSYVSKRSTGMLLAPGMVFTIEPMVNMGRDDILIDEEDGWTVTTGDGLPSAQWEIQVLVTETGYEVLAY